jgi:hypothetical protein
MSINDTRPRVYLAGPILGCTEGEATDWRRFVAEKLLQYNIVGVSPLRCEPIHGERYSADYPDECFGVPRAIAGKNRFDVLTCIMGVFWIPTPEPGRLHSFGTLGELFWTNGLGKQTILVTDDDFIAKHPVIDAAATWKFVVPKGRPPGETFASALRVLEGVLGAYAPGGKAV